jgi:hypothetical protein
MAVPGDETVHTHGTGNLRHEEIGAVYPRATLGDPVLHGLWREAGRLLLRFLWGACDAP